MTISYLKGNSSGSAVGTNGVLINKNTIQHNQVIRSDENAVSAGPVTIMPGVQLTIEPGAVYKVV